MAKVTLTLPDDLYWKWREAIPQRRMEQKESAIEAIRMWLDSPPAELSAPENQEAVSVLLDAFRNGDEDRKQALTEIVNSWRPQLKQRREDEKTLREGKQRRRA